MERRTELATFGKSCFWGPDSFFSDLEGVVDTTVGYAQSIRKNPSYLGMYFEKFFFYLQRKQPAICEAVQVEFDPAKTSYDSLLKAFFDNYQSDSKTPWGDKPFIGYHNKDQRIMADQNASERNDTITRIEPLKSFYPAEFGHQHFEEVLKEGGWVLYTFYLLPRTVEIVFEAAFREGINYCIPYMHFFDMLVKESQKHPRI
jgi:peptide methionine sulfoxide reductase MsrA